MIEVPWSVVRGLNLPPVDPKRGGWASKEQIIDMPHMRVRINPPSPGLHGLRVGRTDRGLCLLDGEGVVGLVVQQTVRMSRRQARLLLGSYRIATETPQPSPFLPLGA